MNDKGIVNLKDFEEKTVSLDQVFLDPNNPRFLGTEGKFVSDNRIMDDSIQRTCEQKMTDFGIENLKENIQRVGFLPIDKIVVRPIPETKGKFVVVEGNRRITALRLLRREHESGEIELSNDILDSILQFNVYVYTGKESDIAWVIQGIRHISGIRNWKPYQQARLLTKLIKDKGMKIEDAGKAVGISSSKSAQLIRSYYGYHQSLKDEEFGSKLKEDDFSFFQEAVFSSVSSPLKNWLDWNEKEKRFKNTENLHKYLFWIVGAEGKPPKVDRVIDIRDWISKSIINYPALFRKFELDENMHINNLIYEIRTLEDEPKQIQEWLQRLKKLTLEIEDLPDIKIKMSTDADHFVKLLESLKKIVDAHLKALNKQ